MKKGRDYLVTAIGLLLAAVGIYLAKTIAEPQGIMKTLPFICIGLGCGAFGHGLGGIVSKKASAKNPALAKQIETETKDERNVAIGNMAKAKGFEMATYVYTALLLAFALMGASFTIIIPLVIAYLFVQGYAIYQRFKIEKEM